ncbi:hypothetical protein FB451DRAFT_1385846 [Mycena latifolia]|nr:hypothetical protein FB451DRAFT_1385846 [Mycena latifolia]
MTDTDMGKDGEDSYKPVKNNGQFNKHPKYWYSDGSIVVRVDNSTIYKIHVSMLEKLSEVMKSILSIPDGKVPTDPTREGTELYPLLIPDTTVVEFDDFLQWLYRAEWEALASHPEDRERICTHLLKLADKWEIEVGKQYAITALQNMALSPSRRLHLAGRFTITDWVEPAVREILDKKLTDLTENDVAAIGLTVYSKFVKAKEMLDAEIRRTALVAPAMGKDPAWECHNHPSCLAVWPKLWFDKIGKKLLHPTTPIKLNQIRAEVQKDETLNHPGLSDNCRLDMVLLVAHNLTFADEQIVPACAESIVKYYKSL